MGDKSKASLNKLSECGELGATIQKRLSNLALPFKLEPEIHCSPVLSLMLQTKLKKQGPEYFEEIRSAIASSNKPQNILIELSPLFSNFRQAKELRKWLVDDGRIKAVVLLPPGMMRPASGVSVAVLALCPSGKSRSITFIRPDPDTNDAFLTNKNSIEEVASEYDLQPHRYVRTSGEVAMDAFLGRPDKVLLADIVDIVGSIRPVAAQKNALQALSVVPDDLPTLGPARTPETHIHLPLAASKQTNRFLMAGDILLSIGKSAYKIAVVPDNAPAPGPGGWVASRSVWAYRLKPNQRIDSRALAVFLRSPLGSNIVSQHLAGGEVTNAQSLLSVPVCINTEEAKQALGIFKRLQQLDIKIATLRQEQADAVAGMWAFPQLKK